MKICYISYYPKENYPRQSQFINAIISISENNIIIINKSLGFKGYLELFYKILRERLQNKPDLYILGFRGNEIYFPVRLITLFKPLIFDNFVPFYQAFRHENKWNLGKSTIFLLSPIVFIYEYLTLVLSQKIFTDTKSHKHHLSRLYKINTSKIHPIYLGSQVKLQGNIVPDSNDFKVFFYGTMQKLHGLNYILDAALELEKNFPKIKFEIVGIDQIKLPAGYRSRNFTNVNFYSWLNFDELMAIALRATVCLGGPFGGTNQANNVITGKTFQFLQLSKPVIIGYNQEIQNFNLVDKFNCILVEQKDIKDLISKIIWCYNNKQKIDIIGQNGNLVFKEFFSNKVLVERIKRCIYSN